MFELVVLGSGTAIPHKDRFAAGYALRINNKYLLFDPSAGTIHRAAKQGIALKDISHIFFTHLHPDHTGDLVPLLFALKNPDIGSGIFINIFGPEGFGDFFNRLKDIYGHWIDVSEKAEVSEIPSKGLSAEQWGVQWGSVLHSGNSIGYRVTHKADRKVWGYSGDTDYCEGIVKLVGNADAAVLECSFPDELKSEGHLTPSLCGKIAREGNVRHLVLSHFYPQCDGVDIIAQCRKEYEGKITLATDYCRISI
ncbi:MAG: ribonuclease Z [Nitrospirae bacterium]|nr:ribonuclease Z [Nitrospirota bacterium]